MIAYGYDALGRRTSTTDPLGNITTFEYDAHGRMTKTILPDPDGVGSQTAPETSYTYDDVGNLLTVTDALGNVTSYQYDDLNRHTKTTLPDPDGAGSQTAPETTYVYDPLGRLTSTTGPLGNTTTYAYDSLSRLVTLAQADPDGAGSLTAPVTTYAYDDAGNLTSITDPLGNVTSYAYDDLGRRITMTLPDPDGAGSLTAGVYTYSYDAAGNLLSETDPLSHTTSYAYDHLNRRILITDAEQGETSFTYDAAGNLLSLTDPVGNTTAWVYDALGRTIEETNELNKTRTFEYDSASNLIQRTDRNGRVIEFVYDDLHRRTSELWKDGMNTVRTLTWEYDALGRVTNAADPAAEFDYTYDNLGRRTSVVHDLAGLSFDVELISLFDAANNRTDLKALVGGTADFWNEYAYDNLRHMTSAEQHGAAGGAAVAEKRIDFTYDAAGQWDTITRYANTAGMDLVATSTYVFGDANRLVALTHAKGVNVLADYDWTYDVANRITDFDSATDGSVSYTYDATNQLTDADYDYQADDVFSYDANGNRTNTGYSTGDNNRLISDGAYNYEYDAEGDRTKKTDATTGDYVVYEWDYRNRLTAVRFKTSAHALVKQVEYEYDTSNRRVSRRADANGDNTYETAQRYIYDDSNIVLVFDESEDFSHRYLHGPQVDQILADEDALGDVLWPLADNQGTIRDVAEYNAGMDSTAIVKHLTYNSYGAITSDSAPTLDFLYAYTGREWDPIPELFYYRARWYDPSAGRFLSEDPINFPSGETNLNRYGANAPTLFTDPMGWWAINPLPPTEEQSAREELFNKAAEWERNGWDLAAALLRAWLAGEQTFDSSSFADHYLDDEVFRAMMAKLVLRNIGANDRCKTIEIDEKQHFDFTGGELFWAHLGLTIRMVGKIQIDCDGRYKFDGEVHVSDGWTFTPAGFLWHRTWFRLYRLARWLELTFPEKYGNMAVSGSFPTIITGPPNRVDRHKLP